MRIQHNIAAMNSYRNYTNNANSLSKNLEKLSSGYKINRAGDDAAGLAISEKMRAQIAGLDQAQSNVKDGISLVKTAEGALQEVQDMMNRMVTLATQSANGTYQNEVDRENLQAEVEALKSEIDRIAESSNFNGQKLLDGSLSKSGELKATLGTTAVEFSISGMETTANDAVNGDGKGHTYDGTNAVKVGVAADDQSDGITVDVTTAGTITIKLGTKSADTTYTAEDITAAVRAAAKDVANEGFKKALSNFTMTSDDITLKKSDKTTALTATALEDIEGIGAGLTLQIGDTAETYNQLTVSIDDMHTVALGIDGIDIGNQAGAQDAIQTIKDAINKVSSTRGNLGAIQNRLEHTTNNLSVMKENIQDAESTIRDTDIADEMTEYTKNNILLQSAQAMLAQANQMPQGVLQLLQ